MTLCQGMKIQRIPFVGVGSDRDKCILDSMLQYSNFKFGNILPRKHTLKDFKNAKIENRNIFINF